MKVLVPVDGSDNSDRALRFAAEFAHNYDADVHVVHITDVSDERSEEIVDEARDVLADEDIEDVPEVNVDVRMSEPRYADKVGEDILDIVDEHDYDHVVMGHHGEGVVSRIVLGSAARTVMEDTDVPVTVVP